MKHLYLLLFLLLSTHGFAQWVTIPVNTADTLNDLEYKGGKYFVAGEDSVFLRSDDNGFSFNILSDYNWDNPYEKRVDNISFYDSLAGIASMASIGPILTTTDGGLTWTNYESSDYYNTSAAETTNDSILFIFKGSAALQLDSNLTLHAENSVDIFVDTLLAPVTYYWPGDHFTDGNIGSWTWILRSDDRGETITMGAFPYCPNYVEKAFVLNKDTLCISNFVSDIGLFFSFDGGMTWIGKDRPVVDYDIADAESRGLIYFNEQMHGFISEYDGKLYKTLDAGDSWQQVPGVESTGLNDITFVNDQEGYLVGDAGLVMSTVDGGVTWSQEVSGTTHALNAIDFNDENIIAVGDSGTIIKRPRYLIMGVNVSSLSGQSAIINENGTLQLLANPLPADATNTSVSWSVENLSGEAIISETGLLTAVNNGVVLARATSQANPSIFGEMVITITNQPDTSPLPTDTVVCLGDSFTLNASRLNATYLWQDGSTDSVFTATSGQLFWVTVSNEISTVTDTIYVEYVLPPAIDLGADRSICQGDSLLLDASGTNGDLLWQDGSTDTKFLVTQAGVYWVLAENEACTFSDTVQINVIPLPQINLGSDTLLCEGETVVLQANQTDATYLWQDGSTEASFTVQQAGTYSLEITVNGCLSADSIVVAYTICTGINESEASAVVRAYPNPTTNKLHIQLDKTYSNIQIAVRDARGTEVKTIFMKQSKSLEIDLSSLPSGMYVVTIQTGDVVSSTKVRKE